MLNIVVVSKQVSTHADFCHCSSPYSLKLKLKLKIYISPSSPNIRSEALDGGTSQLSRRREYGEIKTFSGGQTVTEALWQCFVCSACRITQNSFLVMGHARLPAIHLMKSHHCAVLQSIKNDYTSRFSSLAWPFEFKTATFSSSRIIQSLMPAQQRQRQHNITQHIRLTTMLDRTQDGYNSDKRSGVISVSH